jgi:hypothetical protein
MIGSRSAGSGVIIHSTTTDARPSSRASCVRGMLARYIDGLALVTLADGPINGLLRGS